MSRPTPEIDSLPQPNIELIRTLYGEYGADLLAAREFIAAECQDPGMRRQFDDLEAEALYLLVRDTRPDNLVEISPCDGWSTTWLLKAMADNQCGRLESYDMHDRSRQFVPPKLQDRWNLHVGDVRQSDEIPDEIDFLLLDSKHTYHFARWYFKSVVPKVKSGSPIIIHDITSGIPLLGTPGVWTGINPIGTESWKVKRELKKQSIGHFTLGRALYGTFQDHTSGFLAGLARTEVGIRGNLSDSTRNPAIFFFAP